MIGNDWWLGPQRILRDRIYSYFVHMSNEKTTVSSLDSREAGSGQACDSMEDLSCHFSYLTFPKSQATARFIEMISHRWDPSEEVTKQEFPPGRACQIFHSRQGKGGEWGSGTQSWPHPEHGSMSCAQLLMPPEVWKAQGDRIRFQPVLFLIFVGMEINWFHFLFPL